MHTRVFVRVQTRDQTYFLFSAKVMLRPALLLLQVVPARFSFLYGKMHGQWLIKEHHSSAMPQKYEPEVLPQAQVR